MTVTTLHKDRVERPAVRTRYSEWASLARKGNSEAEAKIAAAILPGTRRVLLCHGAGQEADDLANDTVCTVLEKIRSGDIRNPEKIGGFTHSVALRLLANFRKKQKRHQRIQAEFNLGSEVESHESTYDNLVQSELSAAITLALSKLTPPRWRELIWRHYVRGQDTKTICAEMEISQARCHKLLSWARARLKEMLQPQLSTHLGLIFALIPLNNLLASAL